MLDKTLVAQTPLVEQDVSGAPSSPADSSSSVLAHIVIIIAQPPIARFLGTVSRVSSLKGVVSCRGTRINMELKLHLDIVITIRNKGYSVFLTMVGRFSVVINDPYQSETRSIL